MGTGANIQTLIRLYNVSTDIKIIENTTTLTAKYTGIHSVDYEGKSITKCRKEKCKMSL